MRKVIVIVGPTCSGKTNLSLILAKKLNTEIISGDSRQIFKYLNIGTAKPSKKVCKEIRHYFIDELDPDEKFNVSIFENKALRIIKKLHGENKIPIVVGGSGLYIKALIDGIFNTVDSNPELRKKLLDQKEKYGNDYLYDQLKNIDPDSAKEILSQNYKRVMRALETYYLTGKTIKEHQKDYKRQTDLEFHQYGLKWERKKLYENIETRVDEMMGNGLVEEVKLILSKGYSKNLNSLNTVGYKEIISFLNNEIDLETAVNLIKRNSRRFAKRQMTWFNSDKRIKWFDVDESNNLEDISEKIINEITS